MKDRNKSATDQIAEEEKNAIHDFIAQQRLSNGAVDVIFSHRTLRSIIPRRSFESRSSYDRRINACYTYVLNREAYISRSTEQHGLNHDSSPSRTGVVEELQREYRRISHLRARMRKQHNRLHGLQEYYHDAADDLDDTLVVEDRLRKNGGNGGHSGHIEPPEEILAQLNNGQDLLRDPRIFQARYGLHGKQVTSLIHDIQVAREAIVKLGEECMKLHSRCNKQRERMLLKSISPTRSFPASKDDALERRLPGSFETGKRR